MTEQVRHGFVALVLEKQNRSIEPDFSYEAESVPTARAENDYEHLTRAKGGIDLRRVKSGLLVRQ